MEIFDTHAHLNWREEYKDDIDVVLENAKKNGVTHILLASSEITDSEISLHLRAAKKNRGIRLSCMVGVHPEMATSFDEEAKVRLSFIWASENIATNTPDKYEKHMAIFEKLLYDSDDKVRMEAPEIFRVLGKRRPDFVRPYLEQLKQISETDDNRVVRIHCLGAIKATLST